MALNGSTFLNIYHYLNIQFTDNIVLRCNHTKKMESINLMITLSTDVFEATSNNETNFKYSNSDCSIISTSGDEETDQIDLHVEKKRRRKRGR